MFWIIAVLVLMGQETISTSVLFAFALSKNLNLIILSFIFVSITIVQIYIFHYIGLRLKAKKSRNLVTSLTGIYVVKADHFINRWGVQVFLILLASSLFPPFLTSFISSWLDIPFRNKFFSILIGDCIWYITTWSIVFGTSILTENDSRLLIKVVIVSLLFIIFQRRFANQLLSRWS